MALVTSARPASVLRRAAVAVATTIAAGLLTSPTIASASPRASSSLERIGTDAGGPLNLALAADSCLTNSPPLSFDLSTSQRTFVYRLYCSVFLRLPDQAGFDYWVRLASTQRLDSRRIAAQFISSQEFVVRYGALDDHQFLDLVYRNVLGRVPDAGGYAYWDGVMASASFGRNDLMLYFSDSDEFRVATKTVSPRTPSSIPGVGELVWLPPGMTARQAADTELATGTFDGSLCSGYGGRVSWFTPPYEMRWCVNMNAAFDQVTIDGVYVHEAIHARVGALFAHRDALTPEEYDEVTRVAIQSSTANEGLADFWAMRLVPGYTGSPAYAGYVFDNAIWDGLFAKYPVGGALPS